MYHIISYHTAEKIWTTKRLTKNSVIPAGERIARFASCSYFLEITREKGGGGGWTGQHHPNGGAFERRRLCKLKIPRHLSRVLTAACGTEHGGPSSLNHCASRVRIRPFLETSLAAPSSSASAQNELVRQTAVVSSVSVHHPSVSCPLVRKIPTGRGSDPDITLVRDIYPLHDCCARLTISGCVSSTVVK